VNSLPKIVTRQRRGCDLNQGPSAPESSTLTTRLPSHPEITVCGAYIIHTINVCVRKDRTANGLVVGHVYCISSSMTVGNRPSFVIVAY